MKKSNLDKKKFSIKFLIIGESYIGKTSIIYRIIHNEFKDYFYNPFGIDYQNRIMEIGSNLVNILFYDTPGRNYMRNTLKSYYKRVNGFLLVYDITSRQSFTELKSWLQDFQNQNLINQAVICLVGNKSDLEDKRVITYEEGRQLAEENCFCFCEISAKTGFGINEMINNVSEEIIEKMKYDEEKKQKINKINKPTPLQLINNNRADERCAC